MEFEDVLFSPAASPRPLKNMYRQALDRAVTHLPSIKPRKYLLGFSTLKIRGSFQVEIYTEKFPILFLTYLCNLLIRFRYLVIHFQSIWLITIWVPRDQNVLWASQGLSGLWKQNNFKEGDITNLASLKKNRNMSEIIKSLKWSCRKHSNLIHF